MAISRMQQPRQLLENGGILTLEDAKRMAPPGESLAYINPAEAKLLKSIGGAGEDVNGTGIKSYFFKKIFRKAKRAVKKVAKSKVGKAALMAAAAYYAPAMFGGTTGFGPTSTYGKFFGGMKSGIGSFFTPDRLAFNANRASGGGGFFSNLLGKAGSFIKREPGKAALLGLGAAGIAAPFFMRGDEEEVEPETSFAETPTNIADIVQQARQQDPSLRFLPQPQFVRNFYAADGGLAGLRPGYRIGGSVLQKAGQMIKSGIGRVRSLFDDADINVSIRDEDVMTDFGPQAQAVGQDVFITPKSRKAVKVMDDLIEEGYDITKAEDGSYSVNAVDEGALDLITKRLRIGSKGADEFMESQDFVGGPMDEESKMIYDALRNRKAKGGIMDLGGLEKDYRTGGFVELGAEERADDVPARLSKNEFVFTADAVRAAGGGDIDEGAKVMQNMMDNLEAGGTISEESQGMNPAQEMFNQAQMLEGRLA